MNDRVSDIPMAMVVVAMSMADHSVTIDIYLVDVQVN